MDKRRPDLIIILGAYLLASLLIRVFISGGLELDESEQVVLSQVLRWGYGPQPPLYTWLQALFFGIFGTGIFALSLLKNLLLFTTFAFITLIAQRTLGDRKAVLVAVASLFLSPQYGWEFHRTLTNTVLVTAVAAVTLYVVLDLARKPTTSRYLLLGVLAGLGILSKYNFVLLPTALILAALTLKRWRTLVLDPRALLSILAAVLISLGHLQWMAGNLASATSFSAKLEISAGSAILSYGKGVFSLAMAAVGLYWPLLLVGFFVFTKKAKSDQGAIHPDTDIMALLGRTTLVLLGICFVIVLVTKLTRFNDRWLAPLLFFWPIYLVGIFHKRFTPGRRNAFISIAGGVALLMLALFPGRVLLAEQSGKIQRTNHPYKKLAEELREAGFVNGHIIARSHRVGGNLKIHFPESVVNIPDRPDVTPGKAKQTLLIWDMAKSPEPPADLLGYSHEKWGLDPGMEQARSVVAPMHHWEERSMELGYYLIEEER